MLSHCQMCFSITTEKLEHCCWLEPQKQWKMSYNCPVFCPNVEGWDWMGCDGKTIQYLQWALSIDFIAIAYCTRNLEGSGVWSWMDNDCGSMCDSWRKQVWWHSARTALEICEALLETWPQPDGKSGCIACDPRISDNTRETFVAAAMVSSPRCVIIDLTLKVFHKDRWNVLHLYS